MEEYVVLLDDFVNSDINKLMTVDHTVFEVDDERIELTEDNSKELLKKYGQYKINNIRPTIVKAEPDLSDEGIGCFSVDVDFGMVIELEKYILEAPEDPIIIDAEVNE